MHQMRDIRHGRIQIMVFTPRLNVEIPGHTIKKQEARKKAARVLGLGKKGSFDFFPVLWGGGGNLGVQV